MNSEPLKASSNSASFDAIELLKADHQKVKNLFEHLDEITKQGASDLEKSALVGKIRDELSIHESVENDVFFPAVREVLRSKGVLKEATSEQADAGDAIRTLGELTPGDSRYDEKLSALSHKIAEHAAEEESDVFPRVEASDVDTKALGAKINARKEELKQV